MLMSLFDNPTLRDGSTSYVSVQSNKFHTGLGDSSVLRWWYYFQ